MKPTLVTEVDYVIAWLIYFVTVTAGGFIAGALAGGVIGIALGFMGVATRWITVAGAIAGFIVGVPISYVLFRLIVGKFIVRKAEERVQQLMAVAPGA